MSYRTGGASVLQLPAHHIAPAVAGLIGARAALGVRFGSRWTPRCANEALPGGLSTFSCREVVLSRNEQRDDGGNVDRLGDLMIDNWSTPFPGHNYERGG